MGPKYLNNFKKFVSFVVVLCLVGTQITFARDDDSTDSSAERKTAENRIDFQEALPTNELKENGIDPSAVMTMNTTAANEDGQRVDVDLIQVVTSSEKALKVFKLLEKEIRRVHEKNPNEKFKFLYLPDGSQPDKDMELSAQQMVDILNSIDGNTTDVKKEVVDSNIIKKYMQKMALIFDKTSKSDVTWGLLRFFINGTATTIIYNLKYPLPISLIMGVVAGGISGSVGLLIEKYTDWLIRNEQKPSKIDDQSNSIFSKLKQNRDRIYSPETLMIMSPFLIGLQDPDYRNVLAYASGVGATVAVQNIYRLIKQKKPGFAMWYKWYATEALFITVPFMILPAWDIYANGSIFSFTSMSIIVSSYLTALISTVSQGRWDTFITELRQPKLEKAMEQDSEKFTERFTEQNIFEMNKREVKNIFNQYELSVREPYKKYFFSASLVSVISAMTSQLGSNTNNTTLTYAGMTGLALLGASGYFSWMITKFNSKWKKTKSDLSNVVPIRSDILPVCSMLFGI